jgi:hypothetical protein
MNNLDFINDILSNSIISIIDGCYCSEDMIDFIFDAIIRDYKEMLNDYRMGLDDII